MMAANNTKIECKQESPDGIHHVWRNCYPSKGFDFRQCLGCGRLQYIIDKQTYYDPDTNQYVDPKGCHEVRNLVGYDG